MYNQTILEQIRDSIFLAIEEGCPAIPMGEGQDQEKSYPLGACDNCPAGCSSGCKSGSCHSGCTQGAK